jgi:hypothetical protein
MQFLVKYGESDKTKQQDGCRKCYVEGDCSRPGIVMVFAVLEVILWWQLKSSWCGSNVTQYFFFGTRRIWYALCGGQMQHVSATVNLVAMWQGP